jgi:hypothetical protein
MACKRGRDGILLDGCRAGEAELARGAKEGGIEVEAGERHRNA